MQKQTNNLSKFASREECGSGASTRTAGYIAASSSSWIAGVRANTADDIDCDCTPAVDPGYLN